MKKILGLALIVFSALVFVPSAEAQRTYGQDRSWEVRQDRDWQRRKRRNRRYNRNYGYVVRMEQRYIRIGRRVYREVYRSYYTRYGQLIRRELVSRERVGRYDNYNDYDLRRKGIRFNIFLNF